MSRFRTIQYMVDQESGLVWSRVNGEVAIPILDWEGMKPENSFQTNYYLEKYKAFDVIRELNNLKRTRKIPTALKNIHRKFWGMKPLKG